MPDRTVWFARRYPVGSGRNAMVPVSPEGTAAIRRFVAALAGGCAAWFGLTLAGGAGPWWFLAGAAVFAVVAAVAGRILIRAIADHGDRDRTADDYGAGRG